MCDHFTVHDGEIVGTPHIEPIDPPRERVGLVAGVSVGLFTILLGLVIAVQGVGL